ncbi:hypothetical protein [Streptomyces noursei]|uniref:hypothetical protein n=1 Tax=Streptomyces noursei TaxID=1971 RepID=UPI003811F516
MIYEVTIGGPIATVTSSDDDNAMEHFFDRAVDADGTFFEDGEPPLPSPTVTPLVKCPECGAERDLTARGTWETPAELTCSAGHRWTPELGTLPTGRTLMQELLVRAGVEVEDGPNQTA